MSSATVIIVVGGDYLALEICREILKTAGHRVVLLWHFRGDVPGMALRREAEALAAGYANFRHVDEDPIALDALERAGLAATGDASGDAYCVVAVAQDDRLNLRVALLARDRNENVRVTLRQFNPTLGHKIQEGLKHNCTAISPAAHAAATYAASAVDPACFYALPFPTLESMLARATHRRELGVHLRTTADEGGKVFGFSQREAGHFGVAGLTVEAAEKQLGARIVAVNAAIPYLCRGEESTSEGSSPTTPLERGDRVVAFGPLDALKASIPGRQRRRADREDEGVASLPRRLWSGLRSVEPVLRDALAAAVLLYGVFVAYFAATMHWNVPATMYYVLTTMTTVGYGDVTPCHDCATTPLSPHLVLTLFVAMAMMLIGLTIFAIFTATVTSGLNAAALRRTRGLRRIRRTGHVIVCGAGNVGSLVIDYLRELGEQVVVIEKEPDGLLIEMARERKIDLLTGDATSDETIDFCSPESAKSLVGVTNSDTANLEAALGARSRERVRGLGDLHAVLRIDDPAFGNSIQRHFGITSFSPTELTAPTIAGLARFESTRGRFELFGGTDSAQTFQLAERFQGPENQPPPAPPERPGYQVQWIPLYVWRYDAQGKGTAVPVHGFAGEVRPGDRLLFMVPMRQFAEPS